MSNARNIASGAKFVDTAGDSMTGNLGINGYIDLNTSGNRAKLGYDSNNVYIGATSGTGALHFKNNIGSTDAPHSSGDTKMIISDNGVEVNGQLEADYFKNTAVATYNITGSYTSGTNYVFTTRTAIHALGKGEGFYKFLVYSDLYGAGLSHYSTYSSYDTFFFVNSACNTDVRQTLAWAGVNMGHAPNTGNRPIDIKIHHPYSSDSSYPANQKFEFSPLATLNSLDGGAGKTLTIYLYKVG